MLSEFWSTYAIAITYNKSLFFEKKLFLYFGNINSSLAVFCTPDKTCNVLKKVNSKYRLRKAKIYYIINEGSRRKETEIFQKYLSVV